MRDRYTQDRRNYVEIHRLQLLPTWKRKSLEDPVVVCGKGYFTLLDQR